MRGWPALLVVIGCSSGGNAQPPATSSYDCSGPITTDLPTRDAAEKACAELRRDRPFCHVCVQSTDSSGKEIAFSASANADPCGCPSTTVKTSCKACSETGLAGVRVCVSADTCTFASGTGGTFTYEVTTTDAAPVLHTAMTGPGCSVCASWSSDPLSFVSWNIGGGGVRYCMCDTGCCAPQEAQTITLDRGTRTGKIEWPGRQWDGPSDTGAPLGAPFPPGSYAVTVAFTGATEGTVTATLPIVVE